MGLFGRKDWNVIAIIFETKEVLRVNGNRAKGATAEKVRDGARRHERTIFWAVFDQKGTFLEGEPGPGQGHITTKSLQRLIREVATNQTVRGVLADLESGKQPKVSKSLQWDSTEA